MQTILFQADYSDVTKTCNQFRIVEDITEMWDSLSRALQYYSGFSYLFKNLSGPGSYSDPGEVCGLFLDSEILNNVSMSMLKWFTAVVQL